MSDELLMDGVPVFQCGDCGDFFPLDTADPVPLFHEFCDGPLCEECYDLACDAEDRGRALC